MATPGNQLISTTPRELMIEPNQPGTRVGQPVRVSQAPQAPQPVDRVSSAQLPRISQPVQVADRPRVPPPPIQQFPEPPQPPQRDIGFISEVAGNINQDAQLAQQLVNRAQPNFNESVENNLLTGTPPLVGNPVPLIGGIGMKGRLGFGGGPAFLQDRVPSFNEFRETVRQVGGRFNPFEPRFVGGVRIT